MGLFGVLLFAFSVLLCVGGVGASSSPADAGVGFALCATGAGGMAAGAIFWVGDEITKRIDKLKTPRYQSETQTERRA